MKNEQMARFLSQFEASKRDVTDWPEWMRKAANIASASLPENKSYEKQQKAEVEQKLKS